MSKVSASKLRRLLFLTKEVEVELHFSLPLKGGNRVVLRKKIIVFLFFILSFSINVPYLIRMSEV